MLSRIPMMGPNQAVVRVIQGKRNQNKGRNKPSKKPITNPNPQKQQPIEKRTSIESKNEVAPSITKMSYSKAVKTGQQRQTKQSEVQVHPQPGMLKQLSSVIEQLVGCLKALNGTGGSSALPAKNNGKKQKTIQKEIQRGKKTVLNLSKKALSNAEYRLLGKCLKLS